MFNVEVGPELIGLTSIEQLLFNPHWNYNTKMGTIKTESMDSFPEAIFPVRGLNKRHEDIDEPTLDIIIKLLNIFRDHISTAGHVISQGLIDEFSSRITILIHTIKEYKPKTIGVSEAEELWGLLYIYMAVRITKKWLVTDDFTHTSEIIHVEMTGQTPPRTICGEKYMWVDGKNTGGSYVPIFDGKITCDDMYTSLKDRCLFAIDSFVRDFGEGTDTPGLATGGVAISELTTKIEKVKIALKHDIMYGESGSMEPMLFDEITNILSLYVHSTGQ